MGEIYHVTTKKEWQDAQRVGEYRAASLDAEGFIHCCELKQLRGVLQRYFSGKTGLVALVIDTSLLEAPLQYEQSASVNESFPHVYGPIKPEAVVDLYQL